MPLQAIAQANREVQEAIRSDSEKRRGPYKKYSPTARAEIDKYACHYGVAAAAHPHSPIFLVTFLYNELGDRC